MNWWGYARKPRIPEQRARVVRAGQRLAKNSGKNGRAPSPVTIEGRTIARSFWGKAWCENLEAYRDYEYRLPRGRSYVRSGAVLDLDIGEGRIAALVVGSRPRPYEVEIRIKPVGKTYWSRLKTLCAGEIGSLIELLEGRLSDRVMGIVTDRAQGLFPKPGEIEMSCSCPDWATMCKHVAAVMYGVGARLDAQPELLFTLRNVEHGELIAAAVDLGIPQRGTRRKTIGEEDLSSVFGIELTETLRQPPARKKRAVAEPKAPAKRRSAVKSKARTGSDHGHRTRRKGTAKR
jgi:uncharacterized Zn finger protein